MSLNWNRAARMLPLESLPEWRARMRQAGYPYRVRYRGPHGRHQDTPKQNARAFTIYWEQ